MEKNIKYVSVNKHSLYGLRINTYNDFPMIIFAEYLQKLTEEDIFKIIIAIKEGDEYYNFWRNESYIDYYADDYYVIGDPSTGSYNHYDPVPEGMLWIKRDQFIKMLQKWHNLLSKGITNILIAKDGDKFEMTDIV